MKKLVILSPAHPLRGGIASSSERLAMEFQQFGWEVVIYSFSFQYPDFLFPGKTQYSSDPAPANLTIKTKIHSLNPLNWWTTGKAIAAEKPDLIVTRFWLPFMGPSLGTILKIANRNHPTKIVAIADNIVPHEKRIGDRPLTQYFINAVDAFIVMSRSVKGDIRQFTGKPVAYIPHPIYDNYGDLVNRAEALKALQLEENFRYLLFFGFIRAYKGLDLLLEAFADKRFDSMPVKLIIAGEFYDNPESYHQLIEKYNLTDRVILHSDYIPNNQVKCYFGAADLVVQPYKSATQSGISQLAYHFEKPMVVTAVGGLPEIVDHDKNGYVVPVDKDSIADAVIDFFENDKKKVMEQAVKEKKSFFSWGNMVKGILEVVE